MNRESWLTTAAAQITDWYRAHGWPAQYVRVSCGWPQTWRDGAVGSIWAKDTTADDVHYVWVAPIKYDGGDLEILAILAHEVAHTIDFGAGHRGVFVRATRDIGLVGKPTATEWGPKFRPIAEAILADLGPYPFSGAAVGARESSGRCTGGGGK